MQHNWIHRWPWLIPPFLLAIEWALSQHQGFVKYHLALIWRDQPWLVTRSTMATFLRCLLGYWALTFSYLSITGYIASIFRLKLNALLIVSLYLLGYFLISRYVFTEHPGLYASYWSPNYPKYFLLAFFVLAVLARYQSFSMKNTPIRWTALSIISLTALSISGPSGWSTRPRPQENIATPGKPSIVLFGIDGIPASMFEQSDGHNAVMENWQQKWDAQSIRYTQAQAPINSTYASWMSLLSGTHPFDSGIDLLYPTLRLGNLEEKKLLPNRLKKLGYRSVMMTDCATTSYFTHEMGWDELFQIDQGTLGCGRSLFTSTHPLLGLFSQAHFYPELGSFCSALYSPKSFFDAVESKTRELQEQKEPFFLAVHSCLTHTTMHAHLPPHDSPIVQNLPIEIMESGKKDNLKRSARWVDHYLDKLITVAREPEKKRPWFIVHADHGSRIERRANRLSYFTHAAGLPRNKFQYHVPLRVLSPKLEPGSMTEMVTTTQLYEGILSIAEKNKFALLPESEVLQISSLPIPFGQMHQRLDIYRSVQSQPDGRQHFSAEASQTMRQLQTVALLTPPFRLVRIEHNSYLLFNESQDPFNETDLSKKEPNLVHRLRKQLCEKLPELDDCHMKQKSTL